MSEYLKGQEDLIAKIKADVLKLETELEKSTPDQINNNLPLDVLFLLKNIKPLVP